MTEQRDDRSPFAVAMELVSLATTISLEMVATVFLGYWLDKWLGTRGPFLIAGTILGFVVALVSLCRLQKPSGPKKPPE